MTDVREFQYLHLVTPGVFFLDHRLAPEVRAMFCAMASRAPLGGIYARYTEVVDAVAEGLYSEARGNEGPTWTDLLGDGVESVKTYRGEWTTKAEEHLCVHPIHPKVQKFFDQFVRMYGHSSILELVGSPSVYVEGVSWWAAYRSFDNPLVSGQEFSTRAVRHKNWPMARECYVEMRTLSNLEGDEDNFHGTITETKEPHPLLKEIHDGWFEVFEAEVEAWKNFFSDADNRAAYGIKDKEPFRPALDRARWAIPGTIATGFAHTANLRVMARVIRDGQLSAKQSGAPAVIRVWDDIAKGYAAALPGLAEMGLREAVYVNPASLDSHLQVYGCYQSDNPDDVVVNLHLFGKSVPPSVRGRKPGEKTYLDPWFNHMGRVDISFQCSLAVARDWHRHRTMMPWAMEIVWSDDDLLQIHHMYEAKSEIGKAKVAEMLKRSTDAYKAFSRTGDQYRAMLCLPLGTKVQMSGQAGLRDAVYALELRAFAVGASFEYQDQAKRAVEQLVVQLREAVVLGGTPIPIDIVKVMGLGGSQEAPIG